MPELDQLFPSDFGNLEELSELFCNNADGPDMARIFVLMKPFGYEPRKGKKDGRSVKENG
jgi:hypothetical protein